jgi:hypothetical protein
LGVPLVDTNRGTICFCLGWDFLNRDFLIKILLRQDFYRDCRDCQDKSRLFEIYRDISTLSRLFEIIQVQKSWQIEKSRSRKMIESTNSCFWDKLLRFTTNSRSWPISQSRSRLLELEGGVPTKLRFLICWDKLFITIEIFSTIETYFMPVLRTRVSIETW